MKIAAILIALSSVPLAAQQPKIINARLETRSGADGASGIRRLISAQTSPAWIAYSVPILPGDRQIGCGDWNGSGNSADHPVRLEGPTALVVLFRVENKSVDRIRAGNPDCELDAGGLPFFWLTDVKPAESIALLSSIVAERAAETERYRGPSANSVVMLIALHRDPVADQVLESLLAAAQPEPIRDQALFWLATSRGKRGFDLVKRVTAQDPSQRVRERAIFSLSNSKEPDAVPALLDFAKNDRDPKIREKALFWLARKAGKKEAAAIAASAGNDPDARVKKRAVMALQQLPNREGVPLLIELARTNKDPEIRKQAMISLGETHDPRATSFFQEVLSK